MRLFKNRKFAVSISVVIVVLATLLGVRGSLNRLARDVEVVFYHGDDDSPAQLGIETHLANRLNSALVVMSLMGRYQEVADEVEALTLARRLLFDSNNISDKYSANESMQSAFAALVEKAGMLELSAQEVAAISQHTSDFMGAQTAILNSRYNQKVQSFMDDSSFFVRLLSPFLFVTSPQPFS